MKISLMSVFAGSAFALALSACGGGSGSSTPDASTNVTCPQFIVAKSLVYPAPNATHVPRNVGLVVISGVSNNATVTLQPDFGAPIVSGSPTPVPSPLPTPNGPAVNGQQSAFKLPTLASGANYNVFVQENAPSPQPTTCPNNVPVKLGTFAT